MCGRVYMNLIESVTHISNSYHLLLTAEMPTIGIVLFALIRFDWQTRQTFEACDTYSQNWRIVLLFWNSKAI